MTTDAGLPIKGYAVCYRRPRMRIVARHAPHSVARGQLALAPGQLFGMIGCRTLSAPLLPYKDRQVLGEQISRAKRSHSAAGPGHPRRSREMTLLADAVPPGRIQFRRIHNVAMRLNMLLSG